MMRAAIADVAISTGYISIINVGLGGRCKGALRQNVLHHTTAIQTDKEHIYQFWKETQKKGGQVATRYHCLTIAISCGH
jgi:hypothetical protein